MKKPQKRFITKLASWSQRATSIFTEGVSCEEDWEDEENNSFHPIDVPAILLKDIKPPKGVKLEDCYVAFHFHEDHAVVRVLYDAGPNPNYSEEKTAYEAEVARLNAERELKYLEHQAAMLKERMERLKK